jgi:hypothetical protein
MQALLDNLTGKEAMNLIATVEQPFKNVPHLPKGLMDFLVKIVPWLAGLGGIMNIVSALEMFNNAVNPRSTFSLLADLVSVNPTYYWVAGVLSLLSGALLLMAFKPLQARAFKGWVYLFWVNMLGIAMSVASIFLISGSWVGTVVGILIGLYILFEFKPYYKKAK